MVKNLPAKAGDVRDEGSIPGSGRSPEEEHGNPLQYSCLENPTDRGAWRATVAQSQTRLKQLSTHALVYTHQMPGAAYPPVMTNKNVSAHCQMSLEGREAKSS